MANGAPRHDVVTLSLGDTLGVLTAVLAPVLARGAIIRRPKVVALSQRLDVDRRAVRRLQRLRRRYGEGPLLLRIPVRRQAVVLAPDDAIRVLDQTPEPFAAASSEKRAALTHFQPEGVLVSTGVERTVRRRFNEAVLETDRPLHHLADRFTSVVRDEAAPLVARLEGGGELTWDDFAPAWFRVVRRVVLGDAARDDTGLTDALAELRAAANWAFVRPTRRIRRARFLSELDRQLARAEPGSLAAVMAQQPSDDRVEPTQQVPQWLFAFDPAGMATFRALALLAAHPDRAAEARAEIGAHGSDRSALLPSLRATVLESLRLWPTTPAVLRQATTETTWGGGSLPAGAGLLLFAPFFHRDDERLPFADRFAPEVWRDEQDERRWPLIPFSAGPARCPGRDLVMLLTSTMLAELTGSGSVRLAGGAALDPPRPLPGILNPYGLRFRLADAVGAIRDGDRREEP